jgi:hypothetical protein
MPGRPVSKPRSFSGIGKSAKCEVDCYGNRTIDMQIDIYVDGKAAATVARQLASWLKKAAEWCEVKDEA